LQAPSNRFAASARQRRSGHWWKRSDVAGSRRDELDLDNAVGSPCEHLVGGDQGGADLMSCSGDPRVVAS
jgi:hypothetical protein